MTINHKFTLEPYKGMNTRHHCPSCQQRDKSFALYIDTETGEHISPSVGRCNHESSCGYHYTPKQYFQDNNISFDAPQYKTCKLKPQTKPASFIPIEIFKASLNKTAFETNHFVSFLTDIFGTKIANELVNKYFIAASKHWQGATVFWQVDANLKIRAGKIMLYNPTTGKRIKEPYDHINWIHKGLKQPEFELKQCFFGEHLLIDKTKPVAIVESEKTAIIASVYLPQFIWLAAGNKEGLNAQKCSILRGRTVILFPDLKAFDKWNQKAKEFSSIAKFTVSDLLERKATETEKKQGFDLADYLIKPKSKTQEPETVPAVQIPIETKPIEQPTPDNWKNDIAELESYFASIALPTHPVKLNRCTTIKDCSLFIESHITTVKSNTGNKTYLPYLNRLQELKQLLS